MVLLARQPAGGGSAFEVGGAPDQAQFRAVHDGWRSPSFGWIRPMSKEGRNIPVHRGLMQQGAIAVAMIHAEAWIMPNLRVGEAGRQGPLSKAGIDHI